MARFEIVREVTLSPDEAWRRLTDWESHERFVPLTRIRTDDAGFVARTGLGPLGFDDPMEVVEWDPPRSCRLEKRGRVVTGWAHLSVSPSPAGSRVVWTEDLSVMGVPSILDRFTRMSGAALFTRVLDGLLAD